MASPKQKALLEFFGIQPPDTVAEACVIIDQLVNDSSLHDQMLSWRLERIWLHPNLYANELKAFKARRVEALLNANNYERGPGCPLRVLTRAQVQAVVDWLDANHPTWDRYFQDPYCTVNLDMFHDGFIPLAAQLLHDVVKRGYEHVAEQTPVF